nr:TcpQ domain-containing protein [uncultured Ruegeria sp.]
MTILLVSDFCRVGILSRITPSGYKPGAAIALLVCLVSTPAFSAPLQISELQETPKLASKQPIQSKRLDPLPLPEGFPGKSASPVITPAATCKYTIVAGDTLSTIASRQLGNMSRWPEIARLNKLTGFSVIHPGQLLRLPCTTGGKGPAAHGTPLPSTVLVWTARPGEHLTDVISRWARKAGYTVVQDGSEEWEVDVPISLRGDFKDALESLIRGFEASGRPLAISLYSNKIIRIGSPL